MPKPQPEQPKQPKSKAADLFMKFYGQRPDKNAKKLQLGYLSAYYTDTQGAARHANVSPATIRAWILSGELKTIKLGGAHIIKLEDLNEAMKVERKPGPKREREEK